MNGLLSGTENHVKKLVIASGKGGTGKTTLVASFASLAGTITIADCDVDASNLNVLLKGSVSSERPFMAGFTAGVMPEKCTACGLCVDRCRFDAIRLADTAIIDPLACEGCALCMVVCPEQAIGLHKKQSGTVYEAQTRFGPLVFAELVAGEGNSGKLVAEVRSTAEKIAVDQKAPLMLVDASPGIGCPVIASLTGASCVLLVTEPTLSGIHDLKRILELTRHFSIPACVCVNKADVDRAGEEEIIRYCRQMDFEYLGSIPYDTQIYKAQCEGLTATEAAAEPVKTAILAIWKKLQSKLAKCPANSREENT